MSGKKGNSRVPQGIIKPEHWTLPSDIFEDIIILAVAAFRSQRSENSKSGLTARTVAWLDSRAWLASSVAGSRRVNFVPTKTVVA